MLRSSALARYGRRVAHRICQPELHAPVPSKKRLSVKYEVQLLGVVQGGGRDSTSVMISHGLMLAAGSLRHWSVLRI